MGQRLKNSSQNLIIRDMDRNKERINTKLNTKNHLLDNVVPKMVNSA